MSKCIVLVYRCYIYTICPRSSDPFYVVPYTIRNGSLLPGHVAGQTVIKAKNMKNIKKKEKNWLYRHNTMCPRSNDPFYIVTYSIKWVTTAWTHGILNGSLL